MRIQSFVDGLIMPTKGSDGAGGFDLYMPAAGRATGMSTVTPLGFAAEVPKGHVALLLPRSGVGVREGLELNNTVGVIDSDYRGEWKAALKLKLSGSYFTWEKDERLLQFILVPVKTDVEFELVDNLDTTERGEGGLGSTGK